MSSGHELHEDRSLRMHRIVMELYCTDPNKVIRFGLENLARWQSRGVECDDFKIWEEMLRFSPQRLPQALTGHGEEAVRLRQSSPFAGLVPEKSRRKILSSVK